MSFLGKSLAVGALLFACLTLVSPREAEARRWVYYGGYYAPAPVVVPSYPVYPAPVVVPRRAVYRSYYAPGYVVPVAPAPVWYYYGY